MALGYVEGLRRPGGNITGFINFEYGFSRKWLELLKEIAPRLRRAAVLVDLNPAVLVGIPQFEAIAAVAPSFGVELSQANVRDAGEIERVMMAVAHEANGGLIVTASTSATLHRDLIITLAARLRLPAVIPTAFTSPAAAISTALGLSISTGRRPIVDRILKGEKPADLPVYASRYGRDQPQLPKLSASLCRALLARASGDRLKS